MSTCTPSLRDDLLWLLPLGFGLFGLYQFGRLLTDVALLVVWLVLTSLIAAGHFLRLRLRRRAWLNAYLIPASPLYQLLRGGLFALMLRLLLAALLAVVLCLGILRLGGREELLLVLSALPMLALIRKAAHLRLSRHVTEPYLPEAVWRVALATTVVMLWLALLAASWWRPGPDFTDATLNQAAWQMAMTEQAESVGLEQALAVAAAMEGVRWWLAQHGLPYVGWPLLASLGWALALVTNAMFVWAWLHACTGILLLRQTWKAR